MDYKFPSGVRRKHGENPLSWATSASFKKKGSKNHEEYRSCEPSIWAVTQRSTYHYRCVTTKVTEEREICLCSTYGKMNFKICVWLCLQDTYFSCRSLGSAHRSLFWVFSRYHLHQHNFSSYDPYKTESKPSFTNSVPITSEEIWERT